MFFFECEQGYVPDNGQSDVTDGSVENYDFEWEEAAVLLDTADETESVDAVQETL